MEEKEGTNNSGVTVKGDEAPDSYRVVARENNEFSGSTAPPVSEAVTTLEAAAVTTQVSAAVVVPVTAPVTPVTVPAVTVPAAAATPVSAPVAAAVTTPATVAPVAAAVTTPATVAPVAAAVTTPATIAPVAAAVTAPTIATVTMPVAAGVTGTQAKKKRGRPRKYGPDGKVVALSPMPISALIPLTGDFSAWKHGKGRSIDSFKKKHKLEFESPGNRVAYSVGANFTPHVITVNPGEDVTMKIISFSQQGSRAICILAANGTISNVTLRQPNSCGGTLTYEGRFEILSLSGSFMPTDTGGTKSRSGGMSVSLAGPDGCVVGGGLAGLLVAAGPVQVVVGSFLPGHQQEHKPKKQRFEPVAITAFTPAPANIISGEVTEGTYCGPKPNLTPSFPFPGDNVASMNPMQGLKNLTTEDKISSPGGESEDASPPKFEVSC